jgi:hypothetical protein
MNKEDIIRMAREAGITFVTEVGVASATPEWLERFAALVAAAEREKMKYDGIHTCNPDCQRPACVAVREAVTREREECAKLCDEKVKAEYATGKVDHNEMGWTQACAIAIRARGNV